MALHDSNKSMLKESLREYLLVARIRINYRKSDDPPFTCYFGVGQEGDAPSRHMTLTP